MHYHGASALNLATFFFLVLLAGTFWRLGGYHFSTSSDSRLSHLGRAMLFQY